jgi:dolichyl-phosphate beta-glucosyltransferase
MEKIYLSIIIPSYNEEANLKRGVLREVYDYLKSKDIGWEVVISDDGSTDESREIVKKQIETFKGFRLLENPHGGKPSALLFGIKSVKGNYILFTDMDQSTPISELSKLLPYTKEDYGAIIGSRGLIRKNFPLYRRAGAVVFMSIRRALILPEITDTQCGFKLFRADKLKEAFPRLEFFRRGEKVIGWKVTSFDVELLHILKKRGSRIKEVKVTWDDKDVSKGKGGGLVRYIRESKEMFGQILRVKLNEIRGLY